MDVAYRYRTASALRPSGGTAGAELLLATSGGVTEAGPALHPHFFRGFLTEPGPAAQALLATAAVARARYFDPRLLASIVADPVATSNTDRLRFESFSACCGVHARLDLLPAALDGEPVTSGTTNVDFNPDMRAALAGVVAGGGPMLLRVGSGEVTVTTETVSVTERKVDLPARWVKGFGEVQALAQRMRLVAALDGAELRPLLRFARSLRVYAPAAGADPLPAPSAWELDLGSARFTLTLSPDVHRGFSGEGALLDALAAGAASADADAGLLGVLLSWDPVIDVSRLMANSGFSSERTVASLARLAAAGRVGYDLREGAFFHRELPFVLAESDHPRLADARSLVAADLVIPVAGGAVVGDAVAGHHVVFGPPHDTCTCPWWGKHRGARGPCKHVLAARMALAK